MEVRRCRLRGRPAPRGHLAELAFYGLRNFNPFRIADDHQSRNAEILQS
jgi:hypothetical protein